MKKFAKLLAMVLAVSMVLTMFVGAYDYNDAADIDEAKAAAEQAGRARASQATPASSSVPSRGRRGAMRI